MEKEKWKESEREKYNQIKLFHKWTKNRSSSEHKFTNEKQCDRRVAAELLDRGWGRRGQL